MDEVMMNDSLRTLVEALQGLVDIDDELLTGEAMTQIEENLKAQLSDAAVRQSINEIIKNFESQNASKQEVKDAVNAITDVLKEIFYGDNQYSANKKKIVDFVYNTLMGIFDTVVNKYHTYAIELPITLDEGAKEPTYAHESDAAADLYAREDQVIPAHSYSNMINTGVHIQLPEGWVGYILPRSSIGAKTPLRLSNSIGVIDSDYRGFLGVIYDNTSDSDYTVHAGDRIAQLLIMPSYRFQAQIVDTLDDSDRGEAGYGSTGK